MAKRTAYDVQCDDRSFGPASCPECGNDSCHECGDCEVHPTDRPCARCRSDRARTKLIEDLASSFAYAVRRRLGYIRFQQMVLANDRESNPAVCHSHDFIDSNVTMANVLKRYGLSPSTEDGHTLWQLA